MSLIDTLKLAKQANREARTALAAVTRAGGPQPSNSGRNIAIGVLVGSLLFAAFVIAGLYLSEFYSTMLFWSAMLAAYFIVITWRSFCSTAYWAQRGGRFGAPARTAALTWLVSREAAILVGMAALVTLLVTAVSHWYQPMAPSDWGMVWGLVLAAGASLILCLTARLVGARAGARAGTMPGGARWVEAGQVPAVLVARASTADGLAAILDEAGSLARRQVTCVFGCGPESDEDERAAMGRMAIEKAYHTIVTSSGYGEEDPGAAIGDIIAGAEYGRYETVVDRREAIERAVEAAKGEELVAIIADTEATVAQDYEVATDAAVDAALVKQPKRKREKLRRAA